MIRDDHSQRWLKGSPHGAIWRCIPLNKIMSLSLESKGRGLLVLSIHLPRSLEVDAVFQESKNVELDLLVKQLER
jgi:hypothetical protein